MKRKLFFADLNYVNPDKEWTIIPFPLNIGFIAAYTQKMLPDLFEIKIFKDPSCFLKAIQTQKPDVVAFSNYIWNKNLTIGFAKELKRLHPDCATVMGGPNYNFTELEWLDSFIREVPEIDFHIEGEGEVKFYNLMACLSAHDFDLAAAKVASPAGTAFLCENTNKLIANITLDQDGTWSRFENIDVDLKRGRLLDLNDVPSPYLTGLLDEFLADTSYCPIIETNRGCPYTCSFCNWGAMGKSKSAMFSQDRVVEELHYIANHNKSITPYLYVGDANFGLFPRDVEIAQVLRDLKDTKGFPQNVYLYFAKNSSEKVVRIAEILKDMTPISLSRQTQNKAVLDNIKRSNISIDTFNSLAELAKKLGIDSNVELIFGLPGESKQSFLDGVEQIVHQKVDGLHIFPAMLLNGSDMGTNASRKRFGLKGEWRLIDGCAGEYGPVRAMEFEEIITESAAISRDEYFELRLFHFLQTLFLDTKIYKDVDVLLGSHSIVDLIVEIIDKYPQAPEPFRQLMEDFIQQAKGEFYTSPPEIFSSEMIKAAQQQSVKLNPLYIAKLLHSDGVRPAFHSFLTDLILVLGDSSHDEIAGVLEFIDASIYPFDDQMIRDVTMHFDAAAFAQRPHYEKTNVSKYLLKYPKQYRYVKPFTYEKFTSLYSGRQHSDKVYEILVHHTHETFRHTLLSRLQGESTDLPKWVPDPAMTKPQNSERVIRLEGGWLY